MSACLCLGSLHALTEDWLVSVGLTVSEAGLIRDMVALRPDASVRS